MDPANKTKRRRRSVLNINSAILFHPLVFLLLRLLLRSITITSAARQPPPRKWPKNRCFAVLSHCLDPSVDRVRGDVFLCLCLTLLFRLNILFSLHRLYTVFCFQQFFFHCLDACVRVQARRCCCRCMSVIACVLRRRRLKRWCSMVFVRVLFLFPFLFDSIIDCFAGVLIDIFRWHQ